MAVKAWRQESALENLNGDWMTPVLPPAKSFGNILRPGRGGGSFSISRDIGKRSVRFGTAAAFFRSSAFTDVVTRRTPSSDADGIERYSSGTVVLNLLRFRRVTVFRSRTDVAVTNLLTPVLG